MDQNREVTVKLILSAAALLLLLVVLRKHYEGVPAASEAVVEQEAWNREKRSEPEDDDREIRVLLTNPDGGYFFDSVEIRLKGRSYHFTGQDIRRRGTVRIQAGDERIEFVQKKGENCPALYAGNFVLRCKEQGIYVVNSLPVEQYLTLVLPGEMPADYPEEALKSQAVLARTYAVRHMLQPALEVYFADLDDTTSYQVYGSSGVAERTTKAVEDTAGYILCDGADVADVYYFSTSCGQTTTTEAWGRTDGDAGKQSVHIGRGEGRYTAEELQDEKTFETYISGRDESDYESGSPWYRWEYRVTLDPKKMFRRIRERYEAQPEQVLSRKSGTVGFSTEYLVDPGRIRDISVTGRSPGGCASELTVIGAKGDVRIRTEYSIRYVLCDAVSEVVLRDGSRRRMDTILPSAFFTIKTGKDKQDVIGYTLVGGGYGHGIGMSQNGAAAMAKTGLHHQQIMAFFYPEFRLIQMQRMGEV